MGGWLRGRVRVQEAALTGARGLQRTLPSEAVHCSSCGYPEIESLNCDACCRWFCYGCMCVSHECVPPGEWSCPECIGQKAYDALLSVRIKASRERWLAGKMSTKERNGFSQLVFDLLCSCAWCCPGPLALATTRMLVRIAQPVTSATTCSHEPRARRIYTAACRHGAVRRSEWDVNVKALIDDNKQRMARDASYLPTMLPFHRCLQSAPSFSSNPIAMPQPYAFNPQPKP